MPPSTLRSIHNEAIMQLLCSHNGSIIAGEFTTVYDKGEGDLQRSRLADDVLPG
jgi:hypothetical protein